MPLAASRTCVRAWSHAGRIAGAPERGQAGDLVTLDSGVDPEHLDRRLLLGSEAIHPHHDRLAAVDGLLRPVCRVLDLALDEARLDGPQAAAHLVDPLQERDRLRLDVVGGSLDRPRTADRVDRARHAGLMGDDLLGAQGQLGRTLRGKSQRLVATVAVKGLRATEHGRQRLHRHADHVVVDLLGRQRASGRLRMEAKLLRPRVDGAKALLHDAGPQAAGRPELRDLLQEVPVRIEEEGQPLPERVDVQPGVYGRLYVGDAVGEGERDLLRRGRSGLPDVVAAHRDRVPPRGSRRGSRRTGPSRFAVTAVAGRCRCPARRIP